MKLKSLSLKNFRRFSSLDIDFDDQITVINARNGQGKTTILDASTIALGTFVGAFDLGKSQGIAKSDARKLRFDSAPDGESQFPVEISATLKNPSISIARKLTGLKNKTSVKDAEPLTRLGESLQQQLRTSADVTLPVIAYYGTGRLWRAHKNMQRKAVLSESRTMGYEDCLSPDSSFTQVQQWMTKAHLAKLQQAEMPGVYGDSNLPQRIRCIQNAVDEVLALEGWSGFHYSVTYEELAMRHAETGVMPVSYLSDGVRSMVSLVADLAFRCARLNGHLGEQAAKLTEGIAFVDEVDMHLHPAWQQRVVQSLLNAFPKVQFIVTTHSPQVLSCVDARSVRRITQQLDPETGLPISVVRDVPLQTKGVASADILARIMEVDPIPDVPEAHWLEQYHALIQQGLHADASGAQLRAKLDAHFGAQHPVMLECNRMIRLQDFKKRLPAFGGSTG